MSILARNVRRGDGELDIVAQDGDVIVFVEVRARRARARFDPAATIGAIKKQRLMAAAARWLGEQGLGGARCRFDILAVSVSAAGFRLRHIPNAFVDDDP